MVYPQNRPFKHPAIRATPTTMETPVYPHTMFMICPSSSPIMGIHIVFDGSEFSIVGKE